MNLDEFESLQGSSDPPSATGATSSVVMRENLQQNNCSIHGYAQLEPQLHLIPTTAGSLVHKDTCRTLCLRPSQGVLVQL